MPGLLPIVFFLILVDLVTFFTLRKDNFIFRSSGKKILLVINFLVSGITWLILAVIVAQGKFIGQFFLSAISLFALLIALFWLPRIIYIIFSWLSTLLARISGRAANLVMNAGYSVSLFIMIILLTGLLLGRNRITTEEVSVEYKDLPLCLDGYTIVQITDLHLNSFYSRKAMLRRAIGKIERLKPDLIVNTGDFVTISSIEMKPFVDILKELSEITEVVSITGNHDEGTYYEGFTEEERHDDYESLKKMIRATGSIVLADSVIQTGPEGCRISVFGNRTSGSIPDISHTNIDSLLSDTSQSGFRILLTHDPTYWSKHIKNNFNIDLTLSGHTHGGQFGLHLGHFRWSPASKFYPEWGGLYGDKNEYLYVNRGLGTIGIPVRIGMPPEITVLRLKKGDVSKIDKS